MAKNPFLKFVQGKNQADLDTEPRQGPSEEAPSSSLSTDNPFRDYVRPSHPDEGGDLGKLPPTPPAVEPGQPEVPEAPEAPQPTSPHPEMEHTVGQNADPYGTENAEPSPLEVSKKAFQNVPKMWEQVPAGFEQWVGEAPVRIADAIRNKGGMQGAQEIMRSLPFLITEAARAGGDS